MDPLADQKANLRKIAFQRRKAAHSSVDTGPATDILLDHLAPFAGQVIAGYMPIRTEIDVLPAMQALSERSVLGVPVIQGAGQPLVFHRWTPDAAMVDGPYGARVPEIADPVVPSVVIVPLVAFDPFGMRLGYGGGFYDRTLQRLREKATVHAVGFAYAAQRMDRLPKEPTDQPLDAIVTETGVLRF